VDLAGYLVILRRRAIALILCLAAGFAGGYYSGHHPTKVYEATSRTFINIPVSRGATIQDTLAGTQISSNVIKTYASIVSSQLVAEHIITQLGLAETPTALKHQINAVAEQDAFIIDISVKDRNPERAKALADAASTALHDTVAELEAGKSDPIRAQLIDDATLPRTPVSPSPTKDLALGLIAGLLAGVALMGVLEALDRTLKSAAEAEKVLGAPALALVARQRGHKRRVALTIDPTAAAGEPYRTLRTSIRFLDPDRPLRTILVSSPTPGDGKTTTAANLAVAFALGGERVVVIDADLRRAQLAEYFGLDRGVGLTSVVMRRAELSEALQRHAGPDHLEILASGPLPPNPSELLGSASMTNLLHALSNAYDIVILDSPPILPVSDAVALSPCVDGVVMVVRHGRTARHAAAEAARRLDAVGGNLVGFVFNDISASDARDYYADYRSTYEALPLKGRREPMESGERPAASV
jgi:capsular exopolysaccharide synthesis family protein